MISGSKDPVLGACRKSYGFETDRTPFGTVRKVSPMDEEFRRMVQDILENPAFLELKKYIHHGPENTVYDHSIATAHMAYSLGLRMGLREEEIRSLTRAALLHDFFGYDWHESWYKTYVSHYRGMRRLTHMHAFIHGEIAAGRARLYFNLTPKQCASIASHMFPLSTSLPKSREAWLLTLADKMVASKEMSLTAGHSMRNLWHRVRSAVG